MMKVKNIPNILAAGTVLNANRTSIPVDLYQIFGYSIQVVITGTPTGTFTLEASDDFVQQTTTAPQLAPSHWTLIANSAQAVAAAGSIMWNVSDVMYNWVRVVYTDGSSGASTAVIASATFNAKGI